MTTEELKLLENLMNEIQELNRILTISVAVKYAEIMKSGNPLKPSAISIRGRVIDGLALVKELKGEV
jgi:hypothetical protein